MCDLISNYWFSFTHSSFDKVLGEEGEGGQGSNMVENSFYGKQYYNLFIQTLSVNNDVLKFWESFFILKNVKPTVKLQE